MIKNVKPRTVYEAIILVGHDEDFEASGLAPVPCRYVPGSPGKIEAMAARVDGGYDLFHPEDAEMCSSPRAFNGGKSLRFDLPETDEKKEEMTMRAERETPHYGKREKCTIK